VRVAHAHLVHVVERVLDVVDAGPAHADTLRHELRAAVQVELVDIGGMRRVGDERQRSDGSAAAQPDRDQARVIDAARHLPRPQPRQRAPDLGAIDAERHAPARAAAAKAHDEAGAAKRAAIAGGEDAQRAVIAVRAAGRPRFIGEAGRPHQRAVAEDPELAFRQARHEFVELHRAARL